MKQKVLHGFSLLLIGVLVILTVATSFVIDEVPDSLTNESYDGYFYIKVKTVYNPKEYRLSGDYFWLYFEDIPEMQGFATRRSKGKYNVTLKEDPSKVVGREKVLENLYMNEQPYELLTDDFFFIIKISNDIIKYENCYTQWIRLTGKNGKDIAFRK
jgi:hypothetical protein